MERAGPTEVALLDERTSEGFRTVFGRLASRASRIEVAVTRIRLGFVDLEDQEIGSVASLKVLLAHVNAMRLSAEAEAVLADRRKARNLRLLLGMLREGRIQVRSAPLGGWAPDFSVFYNADRPTAVLVGHHSFQRPSPFSGPLFVSSHGSVAARLASARFQELWDSAHDIQVAIREILEEAERRSPVPVAEGGPAPGDRN